MCLHFVMFAFLLHLLLLLPLCSNKKLVREFWLPMFIFSSLCIWTSDKAWVPMLWLLAATSRASNFHSYNICLVSFLRVLGCQLGLCSTRCCVFRSMIFTWKPRRQTKTYSCYPAAVWCMAMFTDFLRTKWSEWSSGLLWFRSCGLLGGNTPPQPSP